MTSTDILAGLLPLLQGMAGIVAGSLPSLCVLAAIFTVAGLVATPCNKTRPWWRKPGLATDLAYIVVLPLLMRYGRIACLVIGVCLFYRAATVSAAIDLLSQGYGPLCGLSFPEQVVLYLILSDLILYATHRAFHGVSLWRYHAIHHSSEQIDWISANRFHPFDLFWHSVVGDCVLLLLGISPDVLVWLAPFMIGSSALVHANLNWTFGPLRYVLASPVFHRWHHTAADKGGSSNFAATFPVIDLIFGTYYMPQGALPETYGVTEKNVPEDFIGQLMHPFRRTRPVADQPAGEPAAG